MDWNEKAKERMRCCEDCRRQVVGLIEERQAGPDQSWVAGWTENDEWKVFKADDGGALQWMRALPPEAKDTMRRFPPTAIVRAKPEHEAECPIPMPGCVGIVGGYYRGDLLLAHGPASGVSAQVNPEWVEVVGYRKGLTPADVARVLCDA